MSDKDNKDKGAEEALATAQRKLSDIEALQAQLGLLASTLGDAVGVSKANAEAIGNITTNLDALNKRVTTLETNAPPPPPSVGAKIGIAIGSALALLAAGVAGGAVGVIATTRNAKTSSTGGSLPLGGSEGGHTSPQMLN